MPLDVCPGAQHLRAQLERFAQSFPSARLRMLAEERAAAPLLALRLPKLTDVERARALEAIAALATDWHAPIESEPSPIRVARDIAVCAALELMADVEREREEAIFARLEADDENELRSSDCLERDAWLEDGNEETPRWCDGCGARLRRCCCD